MRPLCADAGWGWATMASAGCCDVPLPFPSCNKREGHCGDRKTDNDCPLKRAAACVRIYTEQQFNPFTGYESQKGERRRDHRQSDFNPEPNSPISHDRPLFRSHCLAVQSLRILLLAHDRFRYFQCGPAGYSVGSSCGIGRMPRGLTHLAATMPSCPAGDLDDEQLLAKPRGSARRNLSVFAVDQLT